MGELSRIGMEGFDRVDNVLLELVLAISLREEPASAVQVPACDPVERGWQQSVEREGVLTQTSLQAILPVLLGAARPAAEGGGFRAFPFYKLAGLSEEPSRYPPNPKP